MRKKTQKTKRTPAPAPMPTVRETSLNKRAKSHFAKLRRVQSGERKSPANRVP